MLDKNFGSEWHDKLRGRYLTKIHCAHAGLDTNTIAECNRDPEWYYITLLPPPPVQSEDDLKREVQAMLREFGVAPAGFDY